MLARALCFRVVRLPYLLICLSIHADKCCYHDISWMAFDEISREYSLAPTDDLIRFWRSKVKVTAGHRDGEGFHSDLGIEVLLDFIIFAKLLFYKNENNNLLIEACHVAQLSTHLGDMCSGPVKHDAPQECGFKAPHTTKELFQIIPTHMIYWEIMLGRKKRVWRCPL